MADRGDLPKIRLNESQYLQVIYSPALSLAIYDHKHLRFRLRKSIFITNAVRSVGTIQIVNL